MTQESSPTPSQRDNTPKASARGEIALLLIVVVTLFGLGTLLYAKLF